MGGCNDENTHTLPIIIFDLLDCGGNTSMRIDASPAIIDRCTELEISIETALAIGKESGYGDTAAVCWAVGLDPATLQPLRPRNWARIAADTSSVSYIAKMTEETLILILASGEVPSAFIAQVSHLLDEAPAQILVMAAEQACLQAGRTMSVIWSNIVALANKTGSRRPHAWGLQC